MNHLASVILLQQHEGTQKLTSGKTFCKATWVFLGIPDRHQNQSQGLMLTFLRKHTSEFLLLQLITWLMPRMGGQPPLRAAISQCGLPPGPWHCPAQGSLQPATQLLPHPSSNEAATVGGPEVLCAHRCHHPLLRISESPFLCPSRLPLGESGVSHLRMRQRDSQRNPKF